MKDAQAAAASIPVATARRFSGGWLDYIDLTKPRLNALVVASSAAGYYLGTQAARDLPVAPGLGTLRVTSGIDAGLMAQAVIGTALVAGGAAVLNQVYERRTDALMRRTRLRPLPDGRIAPADARTFGVLLSASGLLILATRANWLAASLALLTLAVYLAIYTPMKRRTSSATLIGAVPGALPPLIGWTASHGSIALGGATLFTILFLWQIPHFMAISWLYRDDYGKAGFPMLPVIEPDGRKTGRQAALYAAALLPTSLVPGAIGLSEWPYLAIALVLGIALLWLSVEFARARSDRSARALFFASIAYLPLLWIAMMATHRG
jgi:protoheme IX farnesyltransferase